MKRHETRTAHPGEERAPRKPRVLAAFGGMVIVSGMERMSFEVLRVLRDDGAQVHCILNSWENHRIVPLVESIGAQWSVGGNTVRLDRHTRNPFAIARMIAEMFRVSARMLRDAARFRPTHLFFPEFISIVRHAPAIVVLRLAGVKVVCRLANHPDPLPFYERLFRHVLPRFTDVFVANSRFATQSLRAAGVPEERIRTIHNTLSTRTAPPPAGVLELVKRAPTILSVGQIASFKGTHIFVSACIEVLPRHPEAQAVILGRRPEWPPDYVTFVEDLERQIAEAGMTDRIILAGDCENAPEVMRAATVLALPILQEETFGNVALEAMSAGLPVVASARGGLTELVTHGETGYLCDEPTVECLVSGIEHFLGDPAARARASQASLAKFASAASPYSREAFVRRWTELFRAA